MPFFSLDDLAHSLPPPAAAHAFQLTDSQGINLFSKQANLSSSGGQGFMDVWRNLQAKASFVAYLLHGYTWVVAAQAHAPRRVVEYAQIADQEAGTEVIPRTRAGRHTQSADEIEFLDEHGPTVTRNVEVGTRVKSCYVGNTTAAG